MQAVALGAEHHEEIRVCVVLPGGGQLLRYSNRVEITVKGRSCIHSERICHRCADGTDALCMIQEISLSDCHHLSVVHDGATHILFLVGCTQGVVREVVVSICREDVGSKRLRLFFGGEKRLLPRCTSRTHCCATREEGQFLGGHGGGDTHHIVVVASSYDAQHIGLATFGVGNDSASGTSKGSVGSYDFCRGRCEISISGVESVALFIEGYYAHYSLLSIIGLLRLAQRGKESQRKGK